MSMLHVLVAMKNLYPVLVFVTAYVAGPMLPC